MRRKVYRSALDRKDQKPGYYDDILEEMIKPGDAETILSPWIQSNELTDKTATRFLDSYLDLFKKLDSPSKQTVLQRALEYKSRKVESLAILLNKLSETDSLSEVNRALTSWAISDKLSPRSAYTLVANKKLFESLDAPTRRKVYVLALQAQIKDQERLFKFIAYIGKSNEASDVKNFVIAEAAKMTKVQGHISQKLISNVAFVESLSKKTVNELRRAARVGDSVATPQ